MPSVTLDLPLPTSTNRLWRKSKRTKKGVYKSEEYERWLEQAGRHWLTQKPSKPVKSISGGYALIVIVAETGRAKDLGNFEKALSDFLQGVGIISNDQLCRKLYVRWGTTQEAPLGCRVTIRSV